jgi:hypothetical protein
MKPDHDIRHGRERRNNERERGSGTRRVPLHRAFRFRRRAFAKVRAAIRQHRHYAGFD